MNKLVVLNHKMNLDIKEIYDYITSLEGYTSKYHLVICPTSIYLPYFKELPFDLGIQNIFYEEKGSYTGEVSAYQASSLGCKYFLAGHSERRKYFNEDDTLVNKKLKSGIMHNMTAILCIGERLEEKEDVMHVLKRQINNALKDIKDYSKIIIAYEPRWAIGSGISLEKDQIKMILKNIKNYILINYQINISVLYGGSVNKNNFLDIIAMEEVDGVLIGSMSLDSSVVKELLK